MKEQVVRYDVLLDMKCLVQDSGKRSYHRGTTSIDFSESLIRYAFFSKGSKNWRQCVRISHNICIFNDSICTSAS